jgi:AbrB family looped-hinge helix DNA binding protein
MALMRVCLRVDQQGKIAIPSNIRREAGLKPGQLVEIEVTGPNQAHHLVIHKRTHAKRPESMASVAKIGGLKTMGRQIRGLSDIRTCQKSKIHSKPPAKGSQYLKLYILAKEKERLQQYHAVIDKSRGQAQTALEDVQKEMQEIAQSLAKELASGQEEPRRRTPGKPMKTMIMNY